jgi:hypothetical protein
MGRLPLVVLDGLGDERVLALLRGPLVNPSMASARRTTSACMASASSMSPGGVGDEPPIHAVPSKR